MLESEEMRSQSQRLTIVGRTLAELLRQGPLHPRPSAWLVARVACAVDHAHRVGVFHRDLKPASILLDAEGQPHVTDSEQAGGRVDWLTAAVDVWALGAILFECLTGRAPFVGEPLLAEPRKVHEEPPAPQPLRPRLDQDLVAVCSKCLHKEREQRYHTALDLAEDLERWLAGEPVRARPLGMLARLWRWCRRHRLT
jgi:serine/threonine protein kinase